MSLTRFQQFVFWAAGALRGATGGNPLPPAEFPPSERVWYIRAESGEVLLTENSDALVQERSAT